MMANLGLGLISVLFIGLTGALVIMAGKILYRLVTGLYEEIHQYQDRFVWGLLRQPLSIKYKVDAVDNRYKMSIPMRKG